MAPLNMYSHINNAHAYLVRKKTLYVYIYKIYAYTYILVRDVNGSDSGRIFKNPNPNPNPTTKSEPEPESDGF